jgi:hypothetical protein
VLDPLVTPVTGKLWAEISPSVSGKYPYLTLSNSFTNRMAYDAALKEIQGSTVLITLSLVKILFQTIKEKRLASISKPFMVD